MSRNSGLIGKYELQRLLGRGSLAEVWKAFDTQVKRSVAIKLLHPDLRVDPNFITRFEREMPVISSLHHPNIVQILDYQVSCLPESDNLKVYSVMNYVKGQTLADYIRNTSCAGQFPSAADMVHLFTAVGGAIDYAHQHGVIHADIKPSNILLDEQYILQNPMGEPKLTDFGIAKMLATSTGTFNSQLSRPLYISPEQALYYPAGNELSDIYSLGVVLYELCTGKLPFEGESTADILMHIISSMPPSPASINPNISQAVSDVILRSLAKDPAERFSKASEMAGALEHALDEPVSENLDWFISLPDNNGMSSLFHPASQGEQVNLDTSIPSLESMDEPADQKAPWSAPVSPPATTPPSGTDLHQSPLSRRPGKSQQPAVEASAPVPDTPPASALPPPAPKQAIARPATVSVPKPSRIPHASKSDPTPPGAPKQAIARPATVSVPKPSRIPHASKLHPAPPATAQPAVEKPAPTPPRTRRSWTLSSFWPIALKPAVEKAASAPESSPAVQAEASQQPAVEEAAPILASAPPAVQAEASQQPLVEELDVPIPEHLSRLISLLDQDGASPMFHPPTQSERADLDTPTASLESMDEPVDQKAPWSPPASPPATIPLSDQDGASPVLDPSSQGERADLDTSTASLESIDEPADQKAPWSSSAKWWSPRKSQQPIVEEPAPVLALESPPTAPSGKSHQPAVEKPTPAPKLPRAPRSRKLGTFRSIVRKQAAEKPVSVLQKHRPSSTRSMAGKVHNVSVAVDLKGKDKQRIQGKRQKARRLYFVACALFLLLLGTAGSLFSLNEYHTYNAKYHADMSLAREGIQHLQRGVTLLETLQQNPLNAPTVQKAQHEFTASLMIFSQLDSELKSLPGISLSLPTYGARLSAALHLLPIAIEVSQTGVIACNTLDLLISRFHSPLDTRAQGIMKADLSVINQNFQRIKTILNLVIGQVNRLQPGDLQLDPRLNKLVTTFHKDIPALQSQLAVAEEILPLVPTVLGIGTPANYLIEVLDPTQLSPGGGIIDSYGTATFSGGQLTTAHITDVDLLDDPFAAAGGQIPFPAAYSWFDLAPTWSFRDSNLDADFPTSARNAEMLYKVEGGRLPLAGVIAVTPALVERALAITGPIDVPEYHETITAQNLVARLHYYRVGAGKQENSSSQPKRFTEVFTSHFLVHLRQLSPPALLKFWQLMISSLHSKDVQMYLNSSAAEHLLQSYHVDAAIQSPASDSLFVVDTNMGANQVNSLITNVLNDQVTIDGEGNAVHHTTLRYAWVLPGQNYGSSLYQDYLRVYAPPGSKLQVQDGWESRGTSQAFGRKVWAGFFTLSSGQTRTITLVWMVPGAAKKGTGGWDYHYTIQRQAGAQWTLHLQVTLPSCAGRITKLGGLVSSSLQGMTLTQLLNGDMNIGVDYTC